MTVVVMYLDNKLALGEEHDADKLARDFVATLKGEINPDYKTSGRLNVEFEFRWFLAGFGSQEMSGYTWDESSWPTLWAALMDYTAEDTDAHIAMFKGLGR